MNDAIKALKITAMTISRSVRQLEGTGLFFTKKEGVQKVLFCKIWKKGTLPTHETISHQSCK